jgi:hypothetical protein
MKKQSTLFPSLENKKEEMWMEDIYLQNIESQGFTVREIDIGDITFLGGQQESIHRWFRLTPSYSPNLVRYFLKYFKATKKDLIFDPFSGRGTTSIESKKEGFDSIATELNPLLQKVGDLSLNWNIKKIDLFDDYLVELDKSLIDYSSHTVEQIAEILKVSIPDIHDVYRWWQKDILKNLLIAKELSARIKYKEIHIYIWIALNMSSLECANIHRNHPTISFDDNHKRRINVYDDLYKRIKEIKSDLSEIKNKNSEQKNSIYLGDAVNIAHTFKELKLTSKPSIIITSPPYPNRFSYIHQTRPQLHFMEIIKDRKEATELDLKAIGGTWGRATSNLMKNLIIPDSDLKSHLNYFDELSEKNLLMCNYATKYFIDIDEHIKGLKKIVSKNFRGAYIVGNSRLSNIEIHTECILAKILKKNNFKVDEILVFRKRGGRKKLYETAVCFTN